jgi:short-subunit dehydrogenase
MDSHQPGRPLALITGASSGIGAAFADCLACDGYDLIIVARRRDRLESLAGKLRERDGVAVTVVVADLTNSADLRDLEKRIATGPALDLLVNNAGATVFSLVAEMDPDRAEETILVQAVAPTRLTRAALRGMIERGSGAIINVSSLMAFADRTLRAPYIGTKAYLNAFTEVLHAELQGTGVRVQALCPGLVDTEIFAKAGMDTSQLPPSVFMPPEDVVTASLRGLALGEVVCLPGLEDPAPLQTLQEARAQVVQQAFTGTLARRYRGG